jgi:hypothetical protein
MPPPGQGSKDRLQFYKNQCGIFKFGAYRRLYFPVSRHRIAELIPSGEFSRDDEDSTKNHSVIFKIFEALRRILYR